MAKPALGILGGDGIAGRTDLLFGRVDRARFGRPQRRLELGPATLNRRHVWGGARHGQQREPGAFQEGVRLREAMGGAMVMTMVAPGLCWRRPGIRTCCRKRRNHRPVGGGGHGHDGDHTTAGERAEHRAAAPVTGSAAIELVGRAAPVQRAASAWC